MKDISALLLFKDMKIFIDKLSMEETGELFKAIFAYANKETVPELSSKVDIVYEMFRKTIDKNEEAYKKKCERNKENAKKRWKKEEENKQEATEVLTEEQRQFLDEFRREFPNKDTNVKISNYTGVNYKELIKQIKRSKFLTDSDNLNLKWCLEHRNEILSGKYRKYHPEQETSKRASGTEEQLNALTKALEGIEE